VGGQLIRPSKRPSQRYYVVAVAAASFYSLALKANGTVVAWGGNEYGRTTVPPTATNVVAVAAGGDFSLALRADGTVIGWGDSRYGLLNVPIATNIVAIAACINQYSLALRSDGKVVAWGDHGQLQLNIPSAATNVVAIAGADRYSLVLRADGTVLGWGSSELITNTPPSATNVVAIATSWSHALALRGDGTIIGWGDNTYGQTTIPPSATNIVSIAVWSDYNLAIRADGLVIKWGITGALTNMIPPSAGDLNLVNLAINKRGTVNTDSPGTNVLSYCAANTAGGVGTSTRSVIVTDTKPPILTLTGASPLNLDVGTPFLEPAATASDACEGNLTPGVIPTGTVNSTLPNRYTLTYTVTDSSGNIATTNRSVDVRDRPAVSNITAFMFGTNSATGLPVIQARAEVNPNGVATAAFAQYGLNTTYPGRTAPMNWPASYGLNMFSALSDGLMPGGTYHYRVAASNSLGVTYGPDQTFTVPMFFAAGDLNGDGRVDEIELDNVLSNFWLTSTSLVMTNPMTLGGGLFQFALTNVSGWNMSMFASTNLTDWELLPAPARPVWQFLDPAYTNYPQRFYRLQWP
jgi:hypothetical protein